MSDGATAWAGLGLFLIGIRLLTSHLKQLSTGPIRIFLTRALNRVGSAELVGFVSGALSQSTSAVTFLATGLLCSGALTLGKALPMLAWANIGTSVLVLLAAVDVRTLVFVLLGAVGIATLVSADQSERSRQILYAALGLGLLLFGLSMIKDSALAAQGNAWIIEFFQFAASAAPIAFLVGLVLAIAVQSSAVVAVLALPLVTSGLIAFDQAVMLIYGASAGSGLAVLLLASATDGNARQLALCQAIVRLTTAGVLVGLLALETHAGVPLVLASVRRVTESLPLQTSFIYLLFQIAFAAIVLLFSKALIRLITRLSPPSHEELLSKPLYLFEEANEEPSTAVAVANLEYQRLLTELPHYLDDLRAELGESTNHLSVDARHEASSHLARQIDEFLDDTLQRNAGMDAAPIFTARTHLRTLVNLQIALSELHSELVKIPDTEEAQFKSQLIEGLHALLGFASEAVIENSPEAYELLHRLTADRSGLIDRVRSKLLDGVSALHGRDALLSAILIFERIVWLLRRLAPTPSDEISSAESTA